MEVEVTKQEGCGCPECLTFYADDIADKIARAIEDGVYAISNGQSESELARSIRDQAAQIARGKK